MHRSNRTSSDSTGCETDPEGVFRIIFPSKMAGNWDILHFHTNPDAFFVPWVLQTGFAVGLQQMFT